MTQILVPAGTLNLRASSTSALSCGSDSRSNRGLVGLQRLPSAAGLPRSTARDALPSAAMSIPHVCAR
jgi:hypothetical protein